MRIAHATLIGQLDTYLAISQGKVAMSGLVPMIEKVNILLDRIPRYLP
jgi:hypothetical protein